MSESSTEQQGKTFIEKKPPSKWKKIANFKAYSKKNKILAVIAVLIIFSSVVSLIGYKYWQSRYYISPEEEALVLQEAKDLMIQGDFEAADAKYQYLISKKLYSQDKANIYQTQSKLCGDLNKYDCSLTAWKNSGQLIKPDYQYYLTLANLLSINGDESGSIIAYRQAYQNMENNLDLSDEDKELKSELKEYLNANQ
ncbi:hypothetical protein KC950_00955 [Candidatus Saccharibacteria bacterium]|nr:hypothetical protein [Candidatus Saccharibacteria bacterium]